MSLLLEFGKEFRRARERYGLAQDELAEILQMKRPSIANIEAGRQNIGINKLILLKDMPQFRKCVPTIFQEQASAPEGTV